MYGGEEGLGVFGVSCGDAAPSFQVQEGVFDEVAKFVELFIIRPLNDTVFLGWYDRLDVLALRLIDESIAVVATIRQQIVRAQSFDQAASLCAICRGTLCNKDSDRQTMRIHGQMYLGVEPPFVRLMSWLPPLAPAAWGWTLQWLASIISHS